uniref:Uncharacterized protein n=1 Tax=Pipistrellus kuhlii TaxID=59472 RepID=A0A7J7TAP2_PIPKU|nr:hypothetical protein mPipKuh1_009672 [Pipistrellus kuhlii]
MEILVMLILPVHEHATAIHPTAQDRCHHRLREVLLCFFVLRQTIRKSHFHSPSTLSLLHQQELWLKLRTALRIKLRIPGKPPQEPICHSPSVTPLRPTSLRLSSDQPVLFCPRAFAHAVPTASSCPDLYGQRLLPPSDLSSDVISSERPP